jgi:SnoaL-like domain
VDANRLADLYEIQKLKARYFRCMDTRDWEGFRGVFADDLVFVNDHSRVPQSATPTWTSADALVDYLSRSHPDKVTIHHGHMPEIEFIDDDNATGIWAMNDWVDDPGRGGAWQGYGHYHERYRRDEDGRWRITSVHLTRLRVNQVPPQRPDSEPSWMPPTNGSPREETTS